MGRATLAGCLHLLANGTGKTPVHVLGREGLSRASKNRELFEELMEAVVHGPGESSRGRPMVSCPRLPLSEERALCASLGAGGRSSSSEGLTRAPGVSSEASLESNEVKLFFISPLPPLSWCRGGCPLGEGKAGDEDVVPGRHTASCEPRPPYRSPRKTLSGWGVWGAEGRVAAAALAVSPAVFTLSTLLATGFGSCLSEFGSQAN